jgi:hypothetical protein
VQSMCQILWLPQVLGIKMENRTTNIYIYLYKHIYIYICIIIYIYIIIKTYIYMCSCWSRLSMDLWKELTKNGGICLKIPYSIYFKMIKNTNHQHFF